MGAAVTGASHLDAFMGNYLTGFEIPNSGGKKGLRLKVDKQPCKDGSAKCCSKDGKSCFPWTGFALLLKGCTTYGRYEFDVMTEAKNSYFQAGLMNRDF